VLGGSILPGEGHSSTAQGWSATPSHAGGSLTAHPLVAASVGVPPARAGVRSRRERFAAPAGESVTDAQPAPQSPNTGAGGSGLAPGGGVHGGGAAPSVGEGHQVKQAQRGRAGAAERQLQLEARKRKSEERRHARAARPPKPGREERQREREAHREEVGLAGKPKSTREERLKALEERRREHPHPPGR
jgi:hypothetical protein